jgi:hypothetical protein
MTFGRILAAFFAVVAGVAPNIASAMNGGTLRLTPRNSWRAFEVISVGDNPAGDGYTWAMPNAADGMGAWLPDNSTLRIEINHELSSAATISEVNLNLPNFQTAIRNVISTGNTGGVTFVTSARQAWTNTFGLTNATFSRFCSGQSYKPDAFGTGRGFVDNIYITGEEDNAATYKRLIAIDLANRDLYQLSGVTGSASGGIGGMPFDAWENAALLDTGDTAHVALLLSPDGGTQNMKVYIGDKGKDAAGNASSSFLARNGLAYGRYFYLNGTFPATAASAATNGTFSTSTAGALNIAKLEDIDTNPNNGTQLVQAIQETGLFTYDFNLAFSGGSFSTSLSNFSLKKIRDQNNDTDGLFGDPDNVDWTMATTLNGTTYPNGLIFVNEDSGTANGETWRMSPDGSGISLIADTIAYPEASETSGVLDISTLVGYKPGSILLTNNQGTTSSQTVLINPYAALAADFNSDGIVDSADYVVWRKGFGTIYTQDDYELWRTQFGRTPGSGAGSGLGDATTVPEPAAIGLSIVAASVLAVLRARQRRLP